MFRSGLFFSIASSSSLLDSSRIISRMQKQFFQVLHRSKKSKARLGTITTAHGIVQTPAFVPVATKATLKSLTPDHIKDLNLQLAFVNTYHLVTHPGTDILEQAKGVHNFGRLPIPLMSDSGGFQVFSLAENKRKAAIHGEETPLVMKIWEDGVIFRSTYDGSTIEFTPEKSMTFQQQIGADIIMAFDECSSANADYKYFKKAMNRTHDWLKRCINYLDKHQKNSPHVQFLYGIIQGGQYEDLRKESAQFILSQPTPGVAIGGVAVGEGKAQMRQQVEWVSPFLPEDRPVHLLGVGELDDIYDTVIHGLDTFDCVEPTRMSRVGRIYQWNQIEHYFGFNGKQANRSVSMEIDISQAQYQTDLSKFDENCTCYTCTNFSKAYLYHLFKQKELLGYTLATIHNLFTMERFMSVLREMIADDLI